MIKKISAIFLALVLCLSVMVVPASAAAELNGTQVAFALEWDKDYYQPGDTAVLSVYMAVADDIPLYTGNISIGLNSAFISKDNVPADCVEMGEVFASYYKALDSSNTKETTSAYQTQIKTANTAEENATYDWYIRIGFAKDQNNGTHPNAANNKDGLYGSEIDPSVPILTFTFTVADGAADGAAIPAAITYGSVNVKTAAAGTSFKYYTAPGTGTGSANIAKTEFDVSNAVATATVGEPAPSCDHAADKITWTQVTAPTCTAAGSEKGVCSCGADMGTREIPATGHNMVAGEVVAPTCTADGYTVYTCANGCGTTENKDTVAATGHKYDTVVTAPTCTEQGYTTYTCACGDTYKDNYVDATGHTYTSAETQAPTCTEAGVKTFTCSCGDSYTEAIPATGHNMVAGQVVAPTCTADGYTVYTCANGCGTTENKDVVAATGHKYDTVVTAPTCTADGYTTYTCACGDTYTADTVAALGHDFSEVDAAKVDATCTADGKEAVMGCSRCDATEGGAVIPATGHTAGTEVVENEVAANCTTDGSYETVVYCTVCDAELSRVPSTVPATGHTAGTVVVENEVAASCGADGSYDNVVYCTVCDAELSRTTEVVKATGEHVYAEVVDEKAATCTDDGYVTKACACGATDTTVVPATGHTAGTEVVENEVAATCTADGSYDTVVYCSVCNAELSRVPSTVPATGHSYTEEITVAPTYGAAGVKTFTCTCGDSYTEAIEALTLTVKHAGSQIIFKTQGGKYVGKFDVRAVAALKKAEFEAAFGTDGSNIVKAGFVFAAGSNVTAPSMDDVKAIVENGATVEGYSEYQVSKISTTLVKGAYSWTCLVKNIPDADKADSLVAVGFIAWDVDGDGAADAYAYYDGAQTVSFEALYDQYFPW